MNWMLLKNSLVVSGGATLLALTMGFAAALWSAGLPRRMRVVFIALAIIALALPPFLIANCWLDLLGNTGAWHGWLPFNILSLGGTVWLLALWLWPITFLAVSGAWQRLGPELLESDPALGGLDLLRAVLVPLARTSLVQAGIVTFVLALNNFTIPAILQVKVFPAEVWVQFNTNFNSLEALKTAWPLLVLPLLLVLWLSRQGVAWPYLGRQVPGSLLRQQLGPPWFVASGAFAVLLVFLSPGLPLFKLAAAKATWSELPGAFAAGKSAAWNSLALAAVASGIVVVAGLAHATLRKWRAPALGQGKWGAALPGSLLWLPFLAPGVLLGIAFINLFNHSWAALLYQGPGIVVLAFVFRYVAFGWNPIWHAVRSVNPDLVDAARLEGASTPQMFRHVYWPHIAPRVAGAWYVIFVLCLWDVESMVLVVPPGGETLALRIFNLLHYGHNAQVNALCIALLGLALLPLLVSAAWRLPKRFFVALSCALALLLSSCSPGPKSEASTKTFSDIHIIGSRGVGVGQLNKPRSLATDREDNVYVVDMTGRVQKFSPSGAFLLSWQMPQTDKGKPKGMCRGGQGDIVVIEPHYSRVNHFRTNGTLLLQWGQPGTNTGQLGSPRAVAVNSRNEVFVSEYGPTERVQRFQLPDPNPTGSDAPRPPKLLNAFGRMGNGPGEFNRPEGLCVDLQDRLYVADSCNHRIQIFDREGHFLRSYGKAGSGKGELSYPYDICIDSAGRQYVCEFGNSRIQVFDTNGCSLEIIGGPGASRGQFANPWGVALDSRENLYVADSQNHRIQKLIRREPVRTASFSPP